MNGVDPSPQNVAAQRALFTGHKVRVFLYNQQVTDALTESFITLAEQNHIPVVGVYETMPVPGYDYQTWMRTEVQDLRKAVADKVLDRAPVRTAWRSVMTNEQRAGAAGRAPLLTLDGIGVRLGGRQVLSDVTFSLEKGDFTGIIGPNGAGKTTLLRVILGLIEPSGGRVLVDGDTGAQQEQGRHRLRAAEARHRPGHAAARPRRGVARP